MDWDRMELGWDFACGDGDGMGTGELEKEGRRERGMDVGFGERECVCRNRVREHSGYPPLFPKPARGIEFQSLTASHLYWPECILWITSNERSISTFHNQCHSVVSYLTSAETIGLPHH